MGLTAIGWLVVVSEQVEAIHQSLDQSGSSAAAAAPPARLGVVLLPRPVDVVEERHGEGHAQELGGRGGEEEVSCRTPDGCRAGLSVGGLQTQSCPRWYNRVQQPEKHHFLPTLNQQRLSLTSVTFCSQVFHHNDLNETTEELFW